MGFEGNFDKRGRMETVRRRMDDGREKIVVQTNPNARWRLPTEGSLSGNHALRHLEQVGRHGGTVHGVDAVVTDS